MYGMFASTVASTALFNSDLSLWNTCLVTSTSWMFSNASSFNNDLSNWNTSKVKAMYGMYAYAPSFNGNLSSWDTGYVTTMTWMFSYASSFNSDISMWDTGRVKSMYGMFASAYIMNGTLQQSVSSFNGDISHWKINQVTTIDKMFYYASSFNQSLCWPATTASKIRLFVGSFGKFSNDKTCLDNPELIINNTMTDATLKYAAYLWVKNKDLVMATYGDISLWDTSRVTDMENVFSIHNPYLNDADRRW